jgi:hypothetical protein
MVDSVDGSVNDDLSLEFKTEDMGEQRSPRLKLNTAADVAREFRRLYRDARSGKIDSSEAERLGNLLTCLSKTIQPSEQI